MNTEDLEGCEFSKKFRAKSSGDIEKKNGLCLTLKSSKLLENPVPLPLEGLWVILKCQTEILGVPPPFQMGGSSLFTDLR